MAPTATDEKLAERIDGISHALADLRLEAEKRFGSIEKGLGDIRTDLAGFRSGVESELRWIKRVGGALAGLVLAVALGSGRVIWDAATVVSEVRQQGGRIEGLEGRMDRVEKRLDGIDGKLDTLLSRTAPRPGG